MERPLIQQNAASLAAGSLDPSGMGSAGFGGLPKEQPTSGYDPVPDDRSLRIQLGDLIRVEDQHKRFLFWCSPAAAARHIDAGEVEVRGTRRRIRTLIWHGAPMEPRREFDYAHPEPQQHARHCSNPWNCCRN